MLRSGAISCAQSDGTSVAKDLCIANAHCQSSLDVLAGLRIPAVYVQRPGVCVEREHIVSSTKLRLRNLQSLSRLIGVVGVVEDQFAVGIIGANALEQRLGFKLGKSFLGRVGVSGQLQGFG